LGGSDLGENAVSLTRINRSLPTSGDAIENGHELLPSAIQKTAEPNSVASMLHVVASQCTPSLKSKIRDYYTLTKPEVNLLILMTTSAGYYLADRSSFHWTGLFWTLLGTLLVASGTATLNQFMEWRYDAQMRRTACRPIPTGRVGATEALCFGFLLAVAGAAELLILVNSSAALFAVATLVSYLLVYTPLKRKTALCTLIGAFPGAMPVLIGWAGASPHLGPIVWFLYATVFLWQFPHFLAIALMYREDYASAGYRMLPKFDLDGRFTRAEIVSFTVGLIVLTLVPVLKGMGNSFYFSGAILAGAFVLWSCIKLLRTGARNEASHLLHATIIYLPVLLIAMVVGKL
jgi:protoheme IX farnesyltransferase